jgi:hypothetical protein
MSFEFLDLYIISMKLVAKLAMPKEPIDTPSFWMKVTLLSLGSF